MLVSESQSSGYRFTAWSAYLQENFTFTQVNLVCGQFSYVTKEKSLDDPIAVVLTAISL
jgi:hypothetical protein